MNHPLPFQDQLAMLVAQYRGALDILREPGMNRHFAQGCKHGMAMLLRSLTDSLPTCPTFIDGSPYRMTDEALNAEIARMDALFFEGKMTAEDWALSKPLAEERKRRTRQYLALTSK